MNVTSSGSPQASVTLPASMRTAWTRWTDSTVEPRSTVTLIGSTRESMPEFPEVEALRRALDDPVRAYPVEKAGPAHVATLKTFDPPLEDLEGRRFAGAERRGKNLLFPTEDGELVLHIHL